MNLVDALPHRSLLSAAERNGQRFSKKSCKGTAHTNTILLKPRILGPAAPSRPNPNRSLQRPCNSPGTHLPNPLVSLIFTAQMRSRPRDPCVHTRHARRVPADTACPSCPCPVLPQSWGNNTVGQAPPRPPPPPKPVRPRAPAPPLAPGNASLHMDGRDPAARD